MHTRVCFHMAIDMEGRTATPQATASGAVLPCLAVADRGPWTVDRERGRESCGLATDAVVDVTRAVQNLGEI